MYKEPDHLAKPGGPEKKYPYFELNFHMRNQNILTGKHKFSIPALIMFIHKLSIFAKMTAMSFLR